MIQVYYNKGMMCYECYVNGVKVDIISIRVDSANMGLPQATITAMIEIVNEQPQELKKPEFPADRIGQFPR